MPGIGVPAATVSLAVVVRSGSAVLSTVGTEVVTGAPVGAAVDLNALAPWVTPLTAPAVTAPIAPAFRESLRFLPPIKDVPAPATKPLVAAIKAGAAVLPNIAVAAGPATMNRAVPITILPIVVLANFLIVLPIFLNSFFRKNSGMPVIGLVVPLPPIRLRICASIGLMWATIVSPLRPASAIA